MVETINPAFLKQKFRSTFWEYLNWNITLWTKNQIIGWIYIQKSVSCIHNVISLYTLPCWSVTSIWIFEYFGIASDLRITVPAQPSATVAPFISNLVYFCFKVTPLWHLLPILITAFNEEIINKILRQCLFGLMSLLSMIETNSLKGRPRGQKL